MDALYPRNLTDVVEILAATGSFLFIAISLLIRQPLSLNRFKFTMVSRKLHNMSQGQTVTSELAQDPSQCPQKVFQKLYKNHHLPHHTHDGVEESDSDKDSKWEQMDELQKARACGNFGSTETSELFLKVSLSLRVQILHLMLIILCSGLSRCFVLLGKESHVGGCFSISPGKYGSSAFDNSCTSARSMSAFSELHREGRA